VAADVLQPTMTRNHNPDEQLLDAKMLRLFELLYTTGSVTRAAEQLGQSQPTVSIWLGKLRQVLDDQLFVRTPEGMVPTPRANELIGPARQALESLRQLAAGRSEFDPANAERRFRICMTDASHITLLPHILAHVRALGPGITLEAALIDGGTARAMQNGEVDLAIGLLPWLEAGFYQQALYPQDWVCLVNSRHPRVGKVLTLDEYRREGHVAIVQGTGAQLLGQALTQAGVRRHVVLDLPGFLGLQTIICSTDLIATLPRHIGETLAARGGLSVHPCPVPVPSFMVKQHWHSRFHQDAGNRWLRGLCAKLFLPHGEASPAAERAPEAPLEGV
jgi:DNA-binding transcriptional LysR family regulator